MQTHMRWKTEMIAKTGIQINYTQIYRIRLCVDVNTHTHIYVNMYVYLHSSVMQCNVASESSKGKHWNELTLIESLMCWLFSYAVVFEWSTWFVFLTKEWCSILAKNVPKMWDVTFWQLTFISHFIFQLNENIHYTFPEKTTWVSGRKKNFSMSKMKYTMKLLYILTRSYATRVSCFNWWSFKEVNRMFLFS